MLFLVLFNLSVSAVSVLDIYSDAGIVHPDDVFNAETYSGWAAILDFIGWAALFALIGGVMAASFYPFSSRVLGESAFVYGAFTGFYFTKTWQSLNIFWAYGNLTTNVDAKLAILVGCGIFGVIVVVAYLSFMLQLVKGPWGTME